MLWIDDDKKKKKKRAVVLAEAPYLGPYGKSERDQTFVTEANNLKEFYQRTEPDTEFEIIPFYGEPDLKVIKERLKDIGDKDNVFLFGHSGDIMGGVSNEVLANTLKESGVKNCYSGSCHFEKRAEAFSGLQNFYYRPNTPWYGVNSRSDNLLSAMYSKSHNQESKSPTDAVNIQKPREGTQYERVFNKPYVDPVDLPIRNYKNPFEALIP